ncbi:MAG: ATPase, partial [Deltaproteobacteria bacterium]|nr:ATPase [Deltaproteobacteria bacterium]
EHFQAYFGPTLLGLGLTTAAATVIEVCSEGSTPIAADILTRAHAPGNAFAFLMAGVATDYTEVMVLKDRTRSWKVSLFLPLVTVPQVVALGWVLNSF